MPESVVVVALLAVCWVAVSASALAAVLPASIIPSKVLPAEHAYVVSIYVGTPPEHVTLEVRFDVAGVWLSRDQSIHSASYALTDGGEGLDIVYFGGVRRRVPVHRGAPPTLASPRLCGECEGVLGLRADSIIWQWWPDATFTAASVTLGGRAPPVVFAGGARNTWELPCESNDIDGLGALCVVAVAWRGETLRAAVMPHAAHTVAPRSVVARYLDGKNIYSARAWEPLTLAFAGDTRAEQPLLVALERSELSGQHGAEARELLIDAGPSNDTVVVGSALLARFAMYRAADRSQLVLHAHPVFTNLPHANSFLFLAVFCFYVRWKSTDLGQHYARAPKRAAVGAVDLAYQAAGWALAVAALFLPATRAVMQDIRALHTTAVVVVFAGIAIEAGARGLLYRVQVAARRAARSLAQVRPNTFLLVLLETIWHEAVLATAMWLLVAPRRSEDLAGPLTVAVGAVAVYSCAVHLTLFAVFTTARFTGGGGADRRHRRQRQVSLALWAFVFVSVAGLFAFFVALFVWVFALPTLAIAAGIYAELAPAITATATALLILTGFGMANAYIEQAVYIAASQHHATFTETAKPREREEGPP